MTPLNVFFKCDEFYLSFNERVSETAQMLDMLAHLMGAPKPQTGPETAICTYNPRKFYILYGDHREGLRNAAQHGLQGCMEYFEQHIYLIGHSSNHPGD